MKIKTTNCQENNYNNGLASGGERECQSESCAARVPESAPALCLNCGTELHRGNFCHVCGQPTATGRITTKNLGINILSGVTRINSRFLYTFFSLLSRPWKVIAEYVRGRRMTYVGPVQMLIILVFINLALPPLLGGSPREIPADWTGFNLLGGDGMAVSVINRVFSFVISSMVMVYIILLIPAVPVVKLFHRTVGVKRYNMAEYVVGAIYMSCFLLVLNIATTIPELLLGHAGIDISGITFFLTVVAMFALLSVAFYKSMSSSRRGAVAKVAVIIFGYVTCLIFYFVIFMVMAMVHELSS